MGQQEAQKKAQGNNVYEALLWLREVAETGNFSSAEENSRPLKHFLADWYICLGADWHRPFSDERTLYNYAEMLSLAEFQTLSKKLKEKWGFDLSADLKKAFGDEGDFVEESKRLGLYPDGEIK